MERGEKKRSNGRFGIEEPEFIVAIYNYYLTLIKNGVKIKMDRQLILTEEDTMMTEENDVDEGESCTGSESGCVEKEPKNKDFEGVVRIFRTNGIILGSSVGVPIRNHGSRVDRTNNK